MPVSLVKSPLYLMLDTETVFNKEKQAFELALVVFDSVTCEVIHKSRFFVKEVLQKVGYVKLAYNEWPIYWPSTRLDLFDCISSSDCKTLADVMASLARVIKHYDIKHIVAHNVAFDISAIYSTCRKYGDVNEALSLLLPIEKLELSGFFVHGLPKATAFGVPYKAKSGCVTFKADYLVPYLTGGIQAHDALGDCLNQLAIYKLTMGKYANRGTIFSNMKAYHAIQHDSELRLGTSELE